MHGRRSDGQGGRRCIPAWLLCFFLTRAYAAERLLASADVGCSVWAPATRQPALAWLRGRQRLDRLWEANNGTRQKVRDMGCTTGRVGWPPWPASPFLRTGCLLARRARPASSRQPMGTHSLRLSRRPRDQRRIRRRVRFAFDAACRRRSNVGEPSTGYVIRRSRVRRGAGAGPLAHRSARWEIRRHRSKTLEKERIRSTDPSFSRSLDLLSFATLSVRWGDSYLR